MALNVIKPVRCLTALNRTFLRCTQFAVLRPYHVMNKRISRAWSLYEPDYLQTGKPKIPLYPTLNVQIKGYVYSVLEKYQSRVFRIAKHLDIDVDDSWGMPPHHLNVQRFKLNSIHIDAEYKLNIYERNIQISDVPAARCPVLIRILQAALPEGIALSVTIYDQEYERKRYVPDKALLDLQSELSDLIEHRTK